MAILPKIGSAVGTLLRSDRFPTIGSVTDNYILFRIAKKLATPLRSWKAYKLGVIDEKGNILIPKDKRDRDQYYSLTNLDVFCLNIKRMFIKTTGRDLAGISAGIAANWLLREYEKIDYETLICEDGEVIANTSSDNVARSSEEEAKAFSRTRRKKLISRFDHQQDDE